MLCSFCLSTAFHFAVTFHFPWYCLSCAHKVPHLPIQVTWQLLVPHPIKNMVHVHTNIPRPRLWQCNKRWPWGLDLFEPNSEPIETKLNFAAPGKKIASFVLITAGGTKMIFWHWQDESQQRGRRGFAGRTSSGAVTAFLKCEEMRDVQKQERLLEGDYICQCIWVSRPSLLPSNLCSRDQDNLVGGGGLVPGAFQPYWQGQATV